MNDCYDCARHQGELACLTCYDSQPPYYFWMPIPCLLCSGRLSEVRYHNGKPYRHCYSCHLEFPVDCSGKAYREETS